uniref:Uncharacterized protein n=1 Tax=Arundo donax TaxID=35708 RepID=A0A0A9B1X5_ARUDO
MSHMKRYTRIKNLWKSTYIRSGKWSLSGRLRSNCRT